MRRLVRGAWVQAEPLAGHNGCAPAKVNELRIVAEVVHMRLVEDGEQVAPALLYQRVVGVEFVERL